MHDWRVACGVLVMIGTACSTVPPPHETIAGADRTIAEAQRVDARRYARLELHLAEEHLSGARAAMREERYAEARELAEKAEVEAQLALTKRNAATAELSVEELRSDIAALRSEIERAAAGRR